VYICICVCMRVLVYIYMRKVYVYMCVNIYMRVYAYIYACTCMGEYVRVCTWTHVDICEGPYHPLWFAAGGTVFIRVRTPNLTGTLIALTGDIIFLSQCLLLWCTLHKWYSHAPQPCAPTVDHQTTTRTRI